MNLGEIAGSLYEDEFDGVSGAPSISAISGWMSGNIGALNVRLHEDFSFSGDFGEEEADIYKNMYMHRYYKKQANSALNGINLGTNAWIRVKEGDTDITRVNRNELAKSYNSIANSVMDDINVKVSSYLLYKAHPRQVAGQDGDWIETTSPTGNSY